tara:strand:+ start:275 stop:1396 length:1122 start_codon:yes stop_codon:yes gene_type:complete
MYLFKNLTIFLKYLLKSKWVFKLPKKNKFVLVDGIHNPFLKYIKKKDFTVLYRRGEEINFAIFLKCLIQLKFTTLDYFSEFIKQVSPKLILTSFDYHTIFYKLSKKTGIKTLALQKGKRGKTEWIFKNRNFFFSKGSKKKFHVDYFFVYSSTVKKFYSKRISGNFFEIGSFENNFTKPVLSKQKNEVVFISNFSDATKEKCENENIIALQLYELAKKNKLVFRILPRYRNFPQILNKEKKFYNQVLQKKFKFILQKNTTSYNLLLNYKYIFSTYSSLATECLAKGMRTGFVMFKSKQNPIFSLRFGDYENLENKGPFWCSSNKLDKKEIERVFKFVTQTNESKWLKKTNVYIKKVIGFDYQNKTFRNTIKSYI